MRILFTTQKPQASTAGLGHFHPLVPLARASEAAGHAVAFACPRSLGPMVEHVGFPAFAAGRDDDADPEVAAVMARVYSSPPGPELTRFFATHVLAGVNARMMVRDLVPICSLWEPDLIVRESTEFGGAVVAEHLGIPHAGVKIGFFYGMDNIGLYYGIEGWKEAMGAQLDRARTLVGLPPDPELEMLYRYLHLSFTPPRFNDPAIPAPRTLHTLRFQPFDQSGGETLPAWVEGLPQRPTVYATLGTEMNKVPGIYPRVLQTIIAGLRDRDLNLIVTVGRDQDPAALGPQPPNVRVERYIPQSLVLPHCDLLLSHGGHNTVLEGVANGLPQVLLPIVADQPDNARRCVALGLGRTLDLATLSPEAVSDVVDVVLGDGRYRDHARQLRGEMEALPWPEHGVRLLEELAAHKAPLRISA